MVFYFCTNTCGLRMHVSHTLITAIVYCCIHLIHLGFNTPASQLQRFSPCRKLNVLNSVRWFDIMCLKQFADLVVVHEHLPPDPGPMQRSSPPPFPHKPQRSPRHPLPRVGLPPRVHNFTVIFRLTCTAPCVHTALVPPSAACSLPRQGQVHLHGSHQARLSMWTPCSMILSSPRTSFSASGPPSTAAT
ncbi:hypothetical protein EDB83DRAFT_1774626 [Lactarius deliciosus]|nr:hypothetical protein EDB83DRAFT_1774626 [Lactarius deliciosus]